MAAGVALGAFGAHALKSKLDQYSMAVFEKALFYHLIHAVAILALAGGTIAAQLGAERVATVCKILLAGIVIFSGSLYLLAITGIKMLGAITPIGGVLFIIGWIYLCAATLRGN